MDCNLSDSVFPRDLSCLHSLQKLYLGGNQIRSLPESVKALTTLQSLHLDFCRSLQWLPELPPSLVMLNAEDCRSLEIITNLPNWLRSLNLDLCDCTELVEIRGLFRLEPIAKVDTKMINYLGLVDLDAMGNIEVDLYNNLTQAGKKGPIQIGGLNVCVVYALHDHDGGWAFDENYLTITNETKGLKWTYAPVFFGMPEANKAMIWLSHWKLSNHLESGDHLNVSFDMNTYFHVKECGVHLLYDKEKKVTESSIGEEAIGISTNPSNQNVIGADLSAYLTSVGLFLLCHYDCMMRRKCLSDAWDPYDYETTVGIPDEGKYMIWSSDWKIVGQLMEGCDEVNVSVNAGPIFQVKEFGICIVCEEQENQCTEQVDVDTFHQKNAIDLSAYEMMTGEYFLCHDSDIMRDRLYSNALEKGVSNWDFVGTSGMYSFLI
ncbi:TMV resistance protein like [Actinidia chinensis var. chinensis]|uniref:TMV resistance protein like n=1 Tax=Actinidia chinensis var. chinensis TaxID=1590841 RepID=A0A2R6R6P6_ACTCC|nr:TMV resistance protein like [Actinidia chinensis var. chinensis]